MNLSILLWWQLIIIIAERHKDLMQHIPDVGLKNLASKNLHIFYSKACENKVLNRNNNRQFVDLYWIRHKISIGTNLTHMLFIFPTHIFRYISVSCWCGKFLATSICDEFVVGSRCFFSMQLSNKQMWKSDS